MCLTWQLKKEKIACLSAVIAQSSRSTQANLNEMCDHGGPLLFFRKIIKFYLGKSNHMEEHSVRKFRFLKPICCSVKTWTLLKCGYS